MTPTLSSGKQDRIISVYRDVMLRSKSVWITHLVVVFALSPLALAVSLLMEKHAANRYGNSFSMPALPTGYVGYFITLALSCLLPLLLFSFLNHRQALDVMHALPVRRDTLFWGNYLAGLTMLVVPLVTLNGISGLVLWLFDVKHNSYFLKIGLCVLAAVIGCYHLMIFIMVNCGTLFESIVYFGILNVSWPAMVAIFFSFVGDHTFGYVEPTGGLKRCLYSLSSLYQLLLNVMKDDGLDWIPIVVALAAALIFLLLGYFLYRQRKSESAGQSFAYRPLFYVSAVLVSICVGVGFYLLAEYGMGFDGKDAPLYLILLGNVFGFLTYFVLDTIRNRGLKRIRMTFAIGLPCALVTTGFCLLCVWTGAFGYETRIPVLSRIESVDLDWDYQNNEFSDLPVGTLHSEEEIARVQEFHRTVVANIARLENRGWQETGDGYDGSYLRYAFDDGHFPADAYGRCETVHLTYHLYGGQTMTRSWNLPLVLTKPLYQAMQSEEYRFSATQQLLKTLQSNRDWRYLNFEDSIGQRYFSASSRSNTEASEIEQLVDALAADLESRTDNWLFDPQQTVYGRISLSGDVWITIPIFQTDRAVCALLDKMVGFYEKEGLEDTETLAEESAADDKILTEEETFYHVAYFTPAAREQIYQQDSSNLALFYRAGTYGYFSEYEEKFAGSLDDISCYELTLSQLEQLRPLITPIGMYETAHAVINLNGICYLVRPECVSQVEAILAESEQPTT